MEATLIDQSGIDYDHFDLIKADELRVEEILEK